MKNLNFEIFNSYFCANLNVQRCILSKPAEISNGNNLRFKNQVHQQKLAHLENPHIHHLLVVQQVVLTYGRI